MMLLNYADKIFSLGSYQEPQQIQLYLDHSRMVPQPLVDTGSG